MKKKGFTLIELLIVIAIIGIMTAIVLAYLSGAKAKGRDSKRIADIKQIEQALEVYFSSCNTYPTNLSSLNSDCGGGNILTSIPKDPSGNSYSYTMTSDPVQYHVCATLELGYAGGIGKSGHSPIDGATPADACNGTAANVFDKYGP